MNRRCAGVVLAVMALGFVVATPAHAGGTSGAAGVKKNANLSIKNKTSNPYYLVVQPASLAEPQTVGDAKKLGAVLINAGKTIVYPVPAGSGGILICDPEDVKGLKSSDPLPEPVTGTGYTVKKGKIAHYRIIAGPTIEPGK